MALAKAIRDNLLNSTVLEPRTESPPAQPSSSAASAKPAEPAPTNPFIYLLAALSGLFTGWVNQKVDDALLTALCVLAFTMILGVWKKDHPWRWLLLVWIGVPLVLAYYQYVVHWPHDRGQVWGAFLQLLAASAGANGGHYMRDMIDHVFLKKDD
jgi:hypothetical protein